MGNILEKIIKEEEKDKLAQLDAINIVNSLFSDLLERERDILYRRFGLHGEKEETLEKIGNSHKLTRERVRQIESASIKKLKKIDKLKTYIETLKKAVNDLLEEHGGLIRREFLLDILTVLALEIDKKKDLSDPEIEKKKVSYQNSFNFLLSKLMGDELEIVAGNDKFFVSFRRKNKKVNFFEELAEDLLSKVDLLKKTYTTEELIKLLKQLDTYQNNKDKFQDENKLDIFRVFKSKVFPDKAEIINKDKPLYSFIQAIKDLDQNKFGEWGATTSQEIKPKTVNDKIYLVLKHESKPMHFTEIASKINEIKFDKKKANPATVHNELILDDRYILISRGTYGLKEWSK